MRTPNRLTASARAAAALALTGAIPGTDSWITEPQTKTTTDRATTTASTGQAQATHRNAGQGRHAVASDAAAATKAAHHSKPRTKRLALRRQPGFVQRTRHSPARNARTAALHAD